MPERCGKVMHHSQEEARLAGVQVYRTKNTVRTFNINTYRCSRCRFVGGKRAWHWGHVHPGAKWSR